MPSGWWASKTPSGSSANALTPDGISDLGARGRLPPARSSRWNGHRPRETWRCSPRGRHDPRDGIAHGELPDVVARPAEAARLPANRPNVLLLVSDDQQMATFTRALMPRVLSRHRRIAGLRFDRVRTRARRSAVPRRSRRCITGLAGAPHRRVDGNSVPLGRADARRWRCTIAGYRTMLVRQVPQQPGRAAPRGRSSTGGSCQCRDPGAGLVRAGRSLRSTSTAPQRSLHGLSATHIHAQQVASDFVATDPAGSAVLRHVHAHDARTSRRTIPRYADHAGRARTAAAELRRRHDGRADTPAATRSRFAAQPPDDIAADRPPLPRPSARAVRALDDAVGHDRWHRPRRSRAPTRS